MSSYIKDIFHRDMDYIFRELASDDLIIYFLNEEKTEVDDVYQEASKKVYDNRIRVTGKVRINVSAGSKEDIWRDNVTVIVPIVEFKLNEVEYDSAEAFRILSQCIIVNNGFAYKVDSLEYSSYVMDIPRAISFKCSEAEDWVELRKRCCFNE